MTGSGTSNPFNADNIERDLAVDTVGRNCLVFGDLDSTNDTAAAIAADVRYDGLAVFAEHQRTGRGRNGSSWFSPPAQNILCSVLLFLPDGQTELTGIVNIASTVAATEAINECFGIDALIKWPNDIYCRGRKLGGILIESRATVDDMRSYVIGIGINVLQKQDQFPPELQETAASIASIGDLQLDQSDRLQLARRLLECLDRRIGQLRGNERDRLCKDWLMLACGTVQPVTITHDDRQFHARIIDIDSQMGILVQLTDALMMHLDAGKARILL